ncbi:hypothetical protein D9546_14720 [Geobacillus stearothermophilus]|nr:hypothetical protein D9546_14720 [Geobacillus stearothermophilus]
MRRDNSQLFHRSLCSLLYPTELLGHSNHDDTLIIPLPLPLQADSKKPDASGQLVAISKMTLLVALSC